jgi:predicted small lipoprotein YifL
MHKAIFMHAHFKSARFFSLLLISFMLAACGRAGPMQRPEPGTTLMKEADKPAEPAVDKPFVLDKLL